MPIVKIEWTAKKTPEEKREFFDFVADLVGEHTGTLPKNIYVYLHEWEPENVRQTAPIALIDWTDMPETRTPAAKKAIAMALTDRLQAMTGEKKEQIVILFTDIPLMNAAQGGVTRYENRNY